MKTALLVIVSIFSMSAFAQEPVQIYNIKAQLKAVEENLAKLKKDLAENGRAYEDNISSLRIFHRDFYRNIIRGGEPERCPECMKSPEWAEAKAGYLRVDKELTQLEKTRLKCTFGLKINGKVIPPSLSWTEEEWKAKVEQSTHQAHRCWLLKSKKKDDYEF